LRGLPDFELPLETVQRYFCAFIPLAEASGNLAEASDKNSRVRIENYEPCTQAPGGQDENDFLIFRLAVPKAEAQFRLGQKTETLQSINQVRRWAYQHKKLSDFQVLSLKYIYNDRNFELYREGFRRQDMILF
jgi:SusD family